jgi:hypothetical protein
VARLAISLSRLLWLSCSRDALQSLLDTADKLLRGRSGL